MKRKARRVLSSFPHWSNNNRHPYSPNLYSCTFCVWSCCQQTSIIFNRCFIFLIYFYFCPPTPFCSLSGLRQVTSTRCHFNNDSARKTEGEKQSICCSKVFWLHTASLLGFAERITSLVNARGKPLLIRGDEGHHFSLSFCFDSVVVKLRSWCLLCALFLGLSAGMLPFLKWDLPKQLMVICICKCYFKEKR